MNKTVKIEAKLLAEILQRLESLKEFAALDTGNGANSAPIFFNGNVDNVTGDEFNSNLEAYVKETTDFLQRLPAFRRCNMARCQRSPNVNIPQSYIGKKVRFPKGSDYDLKDGCGVVESVGPGSARVSVLENRTGQSWDVHWLLLEREDPRDLS